MLWFPQTDAAREARLQKAEEEFQVEDEHTGGQVNSTLQLQREKKEQARLDKLKAAQPVGPQATTPAKAGDAAQQPVRHPTAEWCACLSQYVLCRGLSKHLNARDGLPPWLQHFPARF